MIKLIRRRLLPWRLFDHLAQREQLSIAFTDADRAIHVDTTLWYLLDGDHVGAWPVQNREQTI